MGKKLTIYLIDGTEIGPRTVEIGNWSGKALYSSRINIQKVISRFEFEKPGIYILKSDPKLSIYTERIYIGEAEKLGNRLKQHLVGREFTEFIGFISKDEMLTKGHIRMQNLKTISNQIFLHYLKQIFLIWSTFLTKLN
ncbi:hypothetical protein [Paenibacillus sp. S25]|uniref:hypothetical protein n=1 Tax=Paenibacillus sp. S25 TaxID=2823905 RepID=UPI001C652031|nr:hypothetical protein [Paenibacillus sp. S25]QYK60758.1 hypothetical protein KAI37_01071 [Paenibacillus sp. S25]